MAHVIADTGAAYAEHRVGIQVRVAFHKRMGNQPVIALGLDHEMQMGRTIGILVQSADHLADRPIGWHGIAARLDGTEPKAPLLVGLEHGAQLHVVPLRMLHVIEATSIGLPDIHCGASDRLAACGSAPRPVATGPGYRTTRYILVVCRHTFARHASQTGCPRTIPPPSSSPHART